jgi:hypothetical protein
VEIDRDFDESLALIGNVRERVAPFTPAIVPLFETQGRRVPDLVGCSVAVHGEDGRVFLLTANHVVEAFHRKEDMVAWTPQGGLPVAGLRIAATEIDPALLRADTDDAAVIELLNAETDAFRWTKKHALARSQLDTDDSICRPDEFFGLVGCPSNRVGVDDGFVVPKGQLWVGFTEPDTFGRVGLRPERHVAFEWNNAATHGFPLDDQDRRIVTGQGPSHRGVSGSPMVILANRDGPMAVSGIFTDHRDGHLIGTSVRVHLELIAELLLEPGP